MTEQKKSNLDLARELFTNESFSDAAARMAIEDMREMTTGNGIQAVEIQPYQVAFMERLNGPMDGETLDGEILPPDPGELRVGDIITRDGTDEHEILEIDGGAGGTLTVRCIKAPKDGWCEIGEEEFNMTRRYSLVRRPRR